jgi:hypothetical protein
MAAGTGRDHAMLAGDARVGVNRDFVDPLAGPDRWLERPSPSQLRADSGDFVLLTKSRCFAGPFVPLRPGLLERVVQTVRGKGC